MDMTSLEKLEEEIEEIKKRNTHVEVEKAWEVSWTRRILLVSFTYLTLGFYMSAINIDKPWLNAIIPALGFYISTLTLPFLKKIWQKYLFKN